MSKISFKPDPWLYVITDSKEQARKFFGAPEDWPCRFDREDERGRGKVFAIPTERWVSVSPGGRYKEKLILK